MDTAGKSIAKFAHDSGRRSTMNVRVNAAEIA